MLPPPPWAFDEPLESQDALSAQTQETEGSSARHLDRKGNTTPKGKKRTSVVRRRRRSASEAGVGSDPSMRSATESIEESPCGETLVAFSPAVSSRRQIATRAECPVASSPVAVRERTTIALAQDPRSAARLELSEASRRRHAEGICRALIPAVRLHVEVSEIESALRVMYDLVRSSPTSTATGEHAAEGLRVTHSKLDALDKRIGGLAEEMQMVRTGADARKPQDRSTEIVSAVADYLAGGEVAEPALGTASTEDLRAALLEAQAQADAANAKLRLLQHEALSRLP